MKLCPQLQPSLHQVEVQVSPVTAFWTLVTASRMHRDGVDAKVP